MSRSVRIATAIKESGMWTQVGIQVLSVAATLAYGGLMSALILLGIKRIMGLRVTGEEEMQGLDLALHGERIE
jgi:Amt family ammonium transporter